MGWWLMRQVTWAPALCEFGAGHSSDHRASGLCADGPRNLEKTEDDKHDQCLEETQGALRPDLYSLRGGTFRLVSEELTFKD